MSPHEPTPQCKHLLGNLSEYIDGELQAELCAELEQHLQECDDCRVVVDTFNAEPPFHRQLLRPDDASGPRHHQPPAPVGDIRHPACAHHRGRCLDSTHDPECRIDSVERFSSNARLRYAGAAIRPNPIRALSLPAGCSTLSFAGCRHIPAHGRPGLSAPADSLRMGRSV